MVLHFFFRCEKVGGSQLLHPVAEELPFWAFGTVGFQIFHVTPILVEMIHFVELIFFLNGVAKKRPFQTSLIDTLRETDIAGWKIHLVLMPFTNNDSGIFQPAMFVLREI